MDDMSAWGIWVDIAQKVGAGATFVLVPIAMKLWNALEAANAYIRQSDKESLTIITGLSNAIKQGDEQEKTAREELKTCIDRACERIINHINEERRK